MLKECVDMNRNRRTKELAERTAGVLRRKNDVRYLPAPERIYGGESGVTMQRDLPEGERRQSQTNQRGRGGRS